MGIKTRPRKGIKIEIRRKRKRKRKKKKKLKIRTKKRTMLEESQALVKRSESLKMQMDELSLPYYEKYKKDLICEICGVIVDEAEAASAKVGKSSWHENGRQHMGFQAIREKIVALEKEEATAKGSRSRSKSKD